MDLWKTIAELKKVKLSSSDVNNAYYKSLVFNTLNHLLIDPTFSSYSAYNEHMILKSKTAPRNNARNGFAATSAMNKSRNRMYGRVQIT